MLCSCHCAARDKLFVQVISRQWKQEVAVRHGPARDCRRHLVFPDRPRLPPFALSEDFRPKNHYKPRAPPHSLVILLQPGDPVARRLGPVTNRVRVGCPGLSSRLRHAVLFLHVNLFTGLAALT